jgi:hypothetical protein
MRIVKRNFGLEVDAGRRLSGRNFLPQIVAAVHGCGAGLGGNFGSGFDPGIVNLDRRLLSWCLFNFNDLAAGCPVKVSVALLVQLQSTEYTYPETATGYLCEV